MDTMTLPPRMALARRTRGITLIEMLVVVAILAVIATITGYAVNSLQKSKAREQIIAQTAMEMNQLQAAADKYIRDQYESGSTAPGTTASAYMMPRFLMLLGYLPDNWGLRTDTIPETPLGQDYQFHYQLFADNTYQFFIHDAGVPMAARLARAGLDSTDAAVHAVKQAIAAKLSTEYSLPAGVIAKNTEVVTGNFDGFTKSLAAQMTAPASSAYVAVLRRFPDLEPPPPGGTGGTGGDDNPWGDCTLALARVQSSVGLDGVCPSGYTEVGSWRHCATFAGNVNVVSTEVGSITVGTRMEILDGRSECDGSCDADATGPGQVYHGGYCGDTVENVVGQSCGSRRYPRDQYKYQMGAMDGVPMFEYECSRTVWESKYNGTRWYASQGTYNNVAYTAAKRDLLCCKPRTP